LNAELAHERERIERAERLVGHSFSNRALLLEALTHTSFLNESATAVGSNEQLELVGDAALSLVTVDALLKQTPDSAEGSLTERRAAYVSEAALARAADRHALADLLRTGRAFRDPTPSARADLVEALVGAVYRDAGLEAARAAVGALLGPPPMHAASEDAADGAPAHAKRVLQERLQGAFGEPPTYEVERVDGPNHAPVFRARCVFRGEALGIGEGRNKQAATEGAAAAALASLAAVATDHALRARFADRSS
jgi:ribonuclease III